MDYKQAVAILDKYGRDKCMQIIFDNGRVWLANVPKKNSDPVKARLGYPERDEKGNVVYYTFDELFQLDEATDSIQKIEYQHGTSQNIRDRINWLIVNPIEGIQGFNFLPPNLSPEEEQFIRDNWDHSIT